MLDFSPHYFNCLEQLISLDYLPPAIYEGKRMLIIGDSLSWEHTTSFVEDVKQAFSGLVAQMDIVHLFDPGTMDSAGRLDEARFPSGEPYDLIVLIDGLEMAWNPCRAAEKIDQVLAVGGTLVVIGRMPGDSPRPHIYFYRDRWRYEATDFRLLFPGYDVRYEFAGEKKSLAAAQLCKTSGKPLAVMRVVAGEPKLFHHATMRRVRPTDAARLGYFSANRELDDIGIRVHTDKCSILHNYLDKYEMFLRPYRQKSFSFLELGVFLGASIALWKSYFPHAEIYGVDIDPACKRYEEERVHIVTADLSQDEDVKALREIHPAIIIDDASHYWSHQIKAMCQLYSCLPSGGIYIIEDLETSLNRECFFGFNDYPMDAYTFCERITRVVAGQCPCAEDTSLAKDITRIGKMTEMAAIMMGSCIFIKK